MDRVAIFVDGANLYMTLKSIQFEIDFGKLKKHLARYGKIVRLNYYTAIHKDKITGHKKIKTLVDYLEYNGWTLITKDAQEFNDGRTKGNMDVEFAIDALNAHTYAEQVILLTGDGDFSYLVKEIQRHGTVVRCISSAPMISDRLRRSVDEYIDLQSIREQIIFSPNSKVVS